VAQIYFAFDTMNPLPVLPRALQVLCESVQAVHQDAARKLLQELAACVAQPGDMLIGLPADLAQGHADGYARHIAYADPLGGFTIAYLIWRPGQFSPVHGHKTWCAYRVLKGELTETHYRWDPGAGLAIAHGSAVRRPGDVSTASAGLHQIHRLGNASTEVAVSLHIYGVGHAHIATGC
jgi:predicted metal-dependent enzyme (double-stranded beta helix superfamily)